MFRVAVINNGCLKNRFEIFVLKKLSVATVGNYKSFIDKCEHFKMLILSDYFTLNANCIYNGFDKSKIDYVWLYLIYSCITLITFYARKINKYEIRFWLSHIFDFGDNIF